MSNQNRVLGRIGARILTPEEEAVVVGGIARVTATVCSAPSKLFPHGDGDPGEC
ncbi:MAG TPA: hypothetical protein VG759_25765 [Candidatus Angelobacter sp.]|jgi:hypothetical protein|nr:hypothetical protein [Candidatus Angelobacter sp.]